MPKVNLLPHAEACLRSAHKSLSGEIERLVVEKANLVDRLEDMQEDIAAKRSQLADIEIALTTTEERADAYQG